MDKAICSGCTMLSGALAEATEAMKKAIATIGVLNVVVDGYAKALKESQESIEQLLKMNNELSELIKDRLK